jgi:hypothetical protein
MKAIEPSYIKPLFILGLITWKWKAHWWGSRTSNPVCGANTLVGGFDSHALPPNSSYY